jgi:hypothetical protein
LESGWGEGVAVVTFLCVLKMKKWLMEKFDSFLEKLKKFDSLNISESSLQNIKNKTT